MDRPKISDSGLVNGARAIELGIETMRKSVGAAYTRDFLVTFIEGLSKEASAEIRAGRAVSLLRDELAE